uniref:Uncharacterized protein n=1 Tax=Rhizophora mucronata TaxID=61149 RepID=A0A2P2QD69_RHIMU
MHSIASQTNGGNSFLNPQSLTFRYSYRFQMVAHIWLETWYKIRLINKTSLYNEKLDSLKTCSKHVL